MSFDAGDQAEMTVLILREKEAEEIFGKAREELTVWLKRAKLAKEKGEFDLSFQAKQRALQAKREMEEAQLELEKIAMEKDVLRRSARKPTSC